MADRPIGNVFVRVSADVSKFTRGMTQVERTTQKTRSQLTSFAKNPVAAGVALAAFGVAAGKVVMDLSRLGSELEQTENRFDRVFGGLSDDFAAWIRDFSSVAGVANREAMQLAGTIGAIARGAGFATTEARDLSRTVLELAGDLSAFNDVPVEQAALSITRALNGERESLKLLGVAYTQAERDATALTMTGKSLVTELTAQEKKLAEIEIITQRMGPQVGTLAEEAGDSATAFRRLTSTMSDLKSEIGLLIGAFGGNLLVRGLNAIASAALWGARQIGDLVRAFRDVDEIRARINGTLDQTAEGLEDVANGADQAAAALAPTRMPTSWLRGATQEIEGLTVSVNNLNRAGIGLISRIDGQWKMSFEGLEEQIRNTVDTTMRRLAGRLVQIEQQTMNAGQALQAMAGLVNVLGSAMRSQDSSFRRFLSLLGGIAQVIGAVVAVGNPALGAAISGGGQLLQAGAANFSSGGADISGAQFGSSVNLTLVTEGGRKLVDTISLKDSRDSNMNRILRVPVSAVATG